VQETDPTARTATGTGTGTGVSFFFAGDSITGAGRTEGRDSRAGRGWHPTRSGRTEGR
jgi:hypothetical protein